MCSKGEDDLADPLLTEFGFAQTADLKKAEQAHAPLQISKLTLV